MQLRVYATLCVKHNQRVFFVYDEGENAIVSNKARTTTKETLITLGTALPRTTQLKFNILNILFV